MIVTIVERLITFSREPLQLPHPLEDCTKANELFSNLIDSCGYFPVFDDEQKLKAWYYQCNWARFAEYDPPILMALEMQRWPIFPAGRKEVLIVGGDRGVPLDAIG